jgi:hypothetical protein
MKTHERTAEESQVRINHKSQPHIMKHETYNTARKITTATRPVTTPIIFPDIWSSGGTSDQRPIAAIQANTDPCVNVNSTSYINKCKLDVRRFTDNIIFSCVLCNSP